ncbi:type II toxin-antitoxin system RelE/ParE family toxin [Nocardiopsis sp. NPDC049922]|uniref:type II toxin-antitoxin system RelE/ParE family toxin n=1 Tax=Nocardiopsis sp. NPDC049922 TaxID=3155157 RepID=UPI0033CCC85E
MELVESWLVSLDQGSYEQVIAALQLLSEYGPGVGRPLVDTVRGSRHGNMKELRPGSTGRSELRVLFAFDPKRRAIMLVAGDKTGNWKKWYRVNIPIADDRFDEHIAGLGRGR